MTLRIGWLSPFTNRSGVGTFSKAVTDAIPATYRGEAIDLTIVAPVSAGLYPTRHRFIDIDSTAADSRFYDLFDVVICNIGNNTEHHRAILDVLRNVPSVVICHDYVYQHFLAALVHEHGDHFTDYVALVARYGTAAALRVVRDSNLTHGHGLRYGPWDTDFVATEPLGAPLLHLGAALVVHSAFAERYARSCCDSPVLRLGLPHDMRPSPKTQPGAPQAIDGRGRRILVSFGHVQSTKCIDEVIQAFAASSRLREEALYVISGFAGAAQYVADLRALVDEHRLGACVRFQLDLSDADLSALSEQADGFINLRYPNTEGASASLIEQFCTGKPVVVFDSGCYAEVPDDAVIKVVRSPDPKVLRRALERMLDERETLATIGARGRAYAHRIDCTRYVAELLDFLREQAPLLQRRAAMRGRSLIGLGGAVLPKTHWNPGDDAWSLRLATARTVFDLIDRSALADDPEVLLGLGSEQVADFTQAAILREGRNPVLSAALRAYFQNRSDRWVAARLLHVMRKAVLLGDGEAAAVMADICPHEDRHFWEVVAALGHAELATASHLAFFRSLPLGFSPGPLGRRSGMPERSQLANELARRPAEDLSVDGAVRDAMVAWLRGAAGDEAEASLEPLAVGRRIVIGSREHSRFVRLFGFYTVESDHAWSGEGEGCVYLLPARGARRIELSGHVLQDEIEVLVAARTASMPSLSHGQLNAGAQRITIDLPERAAGETEMLCLSIRNTGCRSPAELGLAADSRPLGFCLHQIAVS